MAFCPNCDTENPDQAARCSSCGSPMTSGTMVIAVPRDLNRPKVTFRVVRADGGPETVVPMRAEVLGCGKAGEIAFPDDPFVAQLQARFFFSNNRLAVEDVGGGNGVFVRLKGERELPMGAEIRVGRQRLVVEPIPRIAPGPMGEVAYGSPDPGYRVRVVQLLEGGSRGSAYPLKEGENLLGREAGDVTFPTDGFVSGRHAVLTLRGDRASIRDNGSSNGTFIRLPAPSYLDDGDQLLVGRELLRVEVKG
jgi:pSer/pThr/pTyr-binding forkhead associated (FHA) protein